MIKDEGLIDRESVGVDADLWSDVARIRGGESEPLIVRRESRLGGSIGVSVRAKSSHCTKPRFLDEDDVKLVVVCL